VSASGMSGSGFSFSECEVFANAVRSVSNGIYGWFCSYGGVQIITNSIIEDNGDPGFGNGGLTGANSALIIHGCRIHDNAGHGIDAVHAGTEVPIVVVGNRITNNSGRSVLANSASVVL